MSDQRAAQHLDTLRDVYLSPTPDRRVDQRLMELLADDLVPRLEGRRVLELGVGDQIWTPRLCARLPEVVTLDGSQQLLDAMRARITSPGWTPVHTLFEDYRPAARFDCVLATFVLEHVAEPAHLLELAANHWLHPGGRIHVAVPHASSLHRRLAVAMGLSSHVAQLGDTDRRLEHTHCFTHVEVEGLLAHAGFQDIVSEGFTCKTLPNRDLAPLSDDQLVGLFTLGRQLPIDYAATIHVSGVALGEGRISV